MKIISTNTKIFTLVQEHPDLLEILSKCGFAEIKSPSMIQSVGRIMTLKMGCKMRRIDIEHLQVKLEQYGYTLIDE